MKEKYFYEVMFDDTSIDVSKEVGLVWSIANSLRGAYTSDKYKDVIIPMVIIRRFECALEATKDAVVARHKQNPNLPAALLCQISKYPFYNYSEYNLKRLLDDSDSIASNLKSYIEGFSANIQLILEKLLKFSTQIDKMDKSNRLYSVVKKFSDLDLYPDHVDSMKMGYIFEDIIRRFSENAEAGDHYTPREVIRLMAPCWMLPVVPAVCSLLPMTFYAVKTLMSMFVCLDRKSIRNPMPFAWQICSSKGRM